MNEAKTEEGEVVRGEGRAGEAKRGESGEERDEVGKG